MFGKTLVSLATMYRKRSTAQTTLVLRSCVAHVAVSCAQPLTIRPSRGYKTTRATKGEMAGRFARGFQVCKHHPTGGREHGEGPTVVESRCLSVAEARRPVRCVGVADTLGKVGQVDP